MAEPNTNSSPTAAKTAESEEKKTETVASPVAAVTAATTSTSEKDEEKKAEATENKNTSEDKNDDDYVPEEEVTEGNWTTPQVEVKEVDVVTGEEDETLYWSQRAKLYRYVKNKDNTCEWKERGLGDAKLLKHNKTNKIRFLLRQEKTHKVVANHYVVRRGDFCKLVPNVSSDKIYVWTVNDYSEDEPKLEQFALKFGTPEKAKEFKTKFEEAASEMDKLLGDSDTSP